MPRETQDAHAKEGATGDCGEGVADAGYFQRAADGANTHTYCQAYEGALDPECPAHGVAGKQDERDIDQGNERRGRIARYEGVQEGHACDATRDHSAAGEQRDAHGSEQGADEKSIRIVDCVMRWSFLRR